MILPEAGDIDITQQDVLVAVGRGVQQQENMEVVEELAGRWAGPWRPRDPLSIKAGCRRPGRWASRA